MPHGGKRPGAGRKKGSRNRRNPAKLGKVVQPVAEHLGAVMLEESRSTIDRVQAAIGLQALQHFIPEVPIPSDGPDTSLPEPDVPGNEDSEVDGFSALTAVEQVIAGQSATLLKEFIGARTKSMPFSHTMVLMEITSMLLAAVSRAAQDIGAGFIDSDDAKRRMERLIYDRTQELLREHNRGVH